MHIIFCERKNTEFSFEPLNALSNCAFLLSAYYATKYIQANNVTDWSIQKLPYLLATIGIGSFMFHSFRNIYTNYADVIPIYLFILFYLYIALGMLIKNKIIVYALIALFGLIQLIVFFTLLNVLYGSVNYIITLGTLLIFSMVVYRKYGKKLVQPLVLFIGVFGVALIFRNIDFIVCPYFIIGTHFLWHILIAFTTYLGIKFLVQLDKVSNEISNNSVYIRQPKRA